MALKMLRKYQKKMLWPFAILIMVTFGITGVMSSVISSWGNPSAITICGQGYSGPELEYFQNRLQKFLGAMQQSSSGLERTLYSYLAGEEEFDLVINYLIFMNEAERLGITVSEKELTEAINDWFRDILIREQIVAAVQRQAEEQYLSQQEMQRRYSAMVQQYENLPESVKEERARTQLSRDRFNSQRYREFVTTYFRYAKVADFERMFENKLVIEKLINSVATRGMLTSDEVYNYYADRNEERKLEIAVFDPRDYEAEVNVSFDEIEEYFSENRENYLRPENVDMEYVVIGSEKIASEMKEDSPPTEEELKKFYEKRREGISDWHRRELTARMRNIETEFSKFFIDEKRLPARNPVYKPFEEITDSVREKYYEITSTEKAEKLARRFKELIEQENSMLAGNLQPGYDLAFDAVEATANDLGFNPGRKAFVRPGDNYLLFDEGHFSDEAFSQLYQQPLYKFSKPVKLEPSGGYVIYRIVKRRMADIPSLAQTQKEVRRDMRLEKSKELAFEAAGELGSKAAEYSMEFEDVETDKPLITFTTNYMKDLTKTNLAYSDFYKLIKNATWLDGAYYLDYSAGAENPQTYQLVEKIILEGFGINNSRQKGSLFEERIREQQKRIIEKQGDISEPFQDESGRAYLVRLQDIRKPSPGDFSLNAEQFIGSYMKNMGIDKFFKEWKDNLRDRAEIKYPGGEPTEKNKQNEEKEEA